MRIDNSTSAKMFRVISYILIALCAIICIIPFWLIVSASLTPESYIQSQGFSFIPPEISLDAYKYVLGTTDKIFDAFKTTFIITIVGTFLGLLIMTMASYVLNRKDFKYRNKISFYLYFTTIFSGGLVPYYILMVKYLHLNNTYWSMIIPSLVSVWSIFLIRNFMKSIPDSLYESAKLDGAGDFKIFVRIVLPLSVPAIATIGLFQALGYWNEWYNASLYITDSTMYPLQLYLKDMVASTNMRTLMNAGVDYEPGQVPTEGMKMAMTVISIGPIFLLYPFLQKYFVRGITVGAVKG